MMFMKIILASKSKARHELLKQIGLDVSAIKSNVDENQYFSEGKDYKDSVKEIAEAKAEKNMHKFKNSIIIAADTVIVSNGRIFGKPKNKKESFDMLISLSGKTHSVITGVCVLNTGINKKYLSCCESKVAFKKLAEKEIENYIKTKEYAGCAGSYGIQGIAQVFVKSIKGSYSNIVGLPLHIVYDYLKRFGCDILEK